MKKLIGLKIKPRKVLRERDNGEDWPHKFFKYLRAKIVKNGMVLE